MLRYRLTVPWRGGLGIGVSGFMLSSHGGVLFDAPAPGETRQEISGQHPSGLDHQPAQQFCAGGFAHINTDREVELVGKGGIVEDSLKPARQDVEGKKVAT